ncbi:MAG: DUF262 domain-containing protein [Gallionella sp.]
MTIKTQMQESTTTPVLLSPENHTKQYEALFLEIDTGQIKLPMFQRDFVWDKEKSAKLIDSILNGFPIGTFIFWKTKEELRSYRNIGNHTLPETPKGDYAQYILDGQQRITSLYAIRKGIRLTRDGKTVDYKDIYINLDFNPTVDEQKVVASKEDGKDYVSVHNVLTQKLSVFYKTLSPEKAEIVEEYKNKLTTYNFSTITIKDYPIEIACEVFSRINTGGKALTIFEIMVAMTYDEKNGFDLVEKYDELINGTEDDDDCLLKAKFETIPETVAMQAVAAIALGSIRAKDILKIRRADFIKNWQCMRESLFSAVDFVRSEMGIPVSHLMPYPVILVPLTYFFHQIKNKKPTVRQISLLEQFYYWAGLNWRYSSAAETKVSEDLKKMADIAKNKSPKYPTNELQVDTDDIAGTWFSAGNANCKAILSLLASKSPTSFDTGGKVILDNSNLKIASSRNYHHFFPKDFVKKKFPDQEPNLIANITLIDGFSNKHRIGAKAPSAYIGKFITDNPKLSKGLRSHLISPSTFGVMEDDYPKFLAERAVLIAEKLNEKLNPSIE